MQNQVSANEYNKYQYNPSVIDEDCLQDFFRFFSFQLGGTGRPVLSGALRADKSLYTFLPSITL